MTKPTAQVLWFQDVTKNDRELVGLKGANLAEMVRIGIPTPNGFILTNKALEDSLLPNIVETEYERFSSQNEEVAVRASAHADQVATFLNIKGKKAVIKAVQKCATALSDLKQENKAVIVQKMVQSEVSGIMFTSNPVNNDQGVIVIESLWGLGGMIAEGLVTPDHFEVDKRNGRIVSKQVVPQEKQQIKVEGVTKNVPVPKAKVNQQKVSDSVIVRIAKLGIKLQNHFKVPQVVEWSCVNGRIYIFESQPILETKGVAKNSSVIVTEITDQEKIILKGASAHPGMVVGTARIVKHLADGNHFKTGEIMVSATLNPDLISSIKKAVAIITDEGGQTSDAAIMSRELGIPCVVGTGRATKTIKDGDKITVDATRGLIYAGEQIYHKKAIALPKNLQSIRDVITKTKLYITASEPEMADALSQKYSDGVGLLQPEFIISEYIGIHPQALIEKGRRKFFIDKLVEGIAEYCSAFGERRVIYKCADFSTGELKKLQGGEKFEDSGQNVLLSENAMFGLEIEAIDKVRNKMGYKNLDCAIPYVRTPEELKEVKYRMARQGLVRRHSFKLFFIAQIPHNVIMIDEYIDVGVDGVLIDPAKLTARVFGLDPNNEKAISRYAQSDPGVQKSLEMMISTCKKRGVRSGIVSNAVALDSEMINKCITWGVESITVNARVVEHARILMHQAEAKQKKTTNKTLLRKFFG